MGPGGYCIQQGWVEFNAEGYPFRGPLSRLAQFVGQHREGRRTGRIGRDDQGRRANAGLHEGDARVEPPLTTMSHSPNRNPKKQDIAVMHSFMHECSACAPLDFAPACLDGLFDDFADRHVLFLRG